jgi:hypothetical protein
MRLVVDTIWRDSARMRSKCSFMSPSEMNRSSSGRLRHWWEACISSICSLHTLCNNDELTSAYEQTADPHYAEYTGKESVIATLRYMYMAEEGARRRRLGGAGRRHPVPELPVEHGAARRQSNG